ncbi:hypothetical protein S83_036247 [Arachis hypogaea]
MTLSKSYFLFTFAILYFPPLSLVLLGSALSSIMYLTIGETTTSTHTLPTNNGASYKGKILLQTLVAELLVFFLAWLI